MLIHTCLAYQEVESAQRLKVSKMSLEVTNEKLEAELEATNQRLREALSRPAMEVADRKTGRASVVTRSALALHTSGRGVKSQRGGFPSQISLRYHGNCISYPI